MRRINLAIVVLPQPDSPTKPNVSPVAMEKLTSSTAFTWPVAPKPNRLLPAAKYLLSPSLGVQPPNPAWGSMIAEARIGLMAGNWEPVAAPAIPIALTVFAFNLLGDWLRIRLDPTQHNL